MENKTKTQSAEVAQASTAQTTSTIQIGKLSPENSLRLLNWLQFHGKTLADIIFQDSALGFFNRLQESETEYYNLIYHIDTGAFSERQPNENPAEVLKDLRENSVPIPRRMAERAYLLRTMGELLEAIEPLAIILKDDYFERKYGKQ